MRAAMVVGVLCAVVVPAVGDPTTYVYQVTEGTVSLDVEPDYIITPDPVVIPLGGTFSVTIDDVGGSVGEGDTFELADADLFNAEEAVADLVFATGTVTAPAGYLFISDFSSISPGQIDALGAGTTVTDVYGGGIVFVDSSFWTGWTWDATWSEQPETWSLAFDIVGGVPVGVTVEGGFTYDVPIHDLGGSVGMGQGVAFTAVLIPEPATCGLIVLALGALARRRR